jgi:hypothetical protein
LQVAPTVTEVTTAGTLRRAPFTDPHDRHLTQEVWFRTCYTHVEYGRETRLSINPFDDGSGSFFVLVNGEEQHEMVGDRK